MMNERRYRTLDAIRGIACLLIIVHHLHHPSLQINFLPLDFRQAWPAVIVFFVLSGFVVTRALVPVLRHSSLRVQNIFRFYLRRIFRLAPTAITVLSGVAAMFLFVDFEDPKSLGQWDRLLEIGKTGLMYFFPVYNLHIVEQGFFIANRLTVAPFWTLAIEDQFYLFIPWILVFIQRFKGSKTLVLGLGYLACAVFFRVWFKLKFPGTSSDEITKYYAHSLTNYDGLLLGVGFGLIYSPTLNVQISLTLSRIIFFGGMLLVWLLPNCFGSGTDRGRDVLGVYWLVTWISLAMIWVAVRTDHCHMSLIPNGIFRRVLLFLGDRSYVLYLIHMPLAKFVRQGLGWDGFFLFSGYPLVLLFAAELIHSGIERPFHRWGKSKFKPLLASDNFA